MDALRRLGPAFARSLRPPILFGSESFIDEVAAAASTIRSNSGCVTFPTRVIATR